MVKLCPDFGKKALLEKCPIAFVRERTRPQAHRFWLNAAACASTNCKWATKLTLHESRDWPMAAADSKIDVMVTTYFMSQPLRGWLKAKVFARTKIVSETLCMFQASSG